MVELVLVFDEFELLFEELDVELLLFDDDDLVFVIGIVMDRVFGVMIMFKVWLFLFMVCKVICCVKVVVVVWGMLIKVIILVILVILFLVLEIWMLVIEDLVVLIL